ncbi:hypothetical protein [Acetobacterium tundrae]|uniref:GGDEF domain-containing protein n=2 Tax=Acetobacterium tundrae TaxID=132932 RepID=A0ABR6WLG2_9FIRM|nr:hypothetical protein [Acetobacterium tundrae]MBC3797005.1 hypothetical protein [Acetobacterium tundrae]
MKYKCESDGYMMDNEKIQPSKLDIILKKKKNLDDTIKECEIRIDKKLASLVEEGIISKEMNPNIFETNFQDLTQSDDHFLSGIDISDDDALDQAVLNSRPFDNKGNQLAFSGDDLLLNKASKSSSIFDANTTAGEEDDDEELPTLSKILGRPSSFSDNYAEETLVPNDLIAPDALSNIQEKPEELIQTSTRPDPSESEKGSSDAFILNEDSLAPETKEDFQTKNKAATKASKSPVSKEKKASPVKTPIQKPNLIDMLMPLIFFIIGLAFFGVFLTLAAYTFNFVDYSVLFILFTCLIFTIAMPVGASIFFMILLLFSYIVISLISVFYLEVPFELYQIGWIVVIPLLLLSSTFLIKKIRELFEFKKSLERQLAAYDNLEESPGLTIEKAHYKDLKYAMERAAKGETILTLEMISISHLKTLESINGSRLWDEILFKTMKIIKMHCYNTHLIYILDGSIFSIIMENTSVKNQLLINQGITEAFNNLILEYDAIDEHVELIIAPVPYSRDITNPFDYRALGLRHLNS